MLDPKSKSLLSATRDLLTATGKLSPADDKEELKKAVQDLNEKTAFHQEMACLLTKAVRNINNCIGHKVN